MEENAVRYWLALKSIEGLGNVGFKNLLSVFGSPRRVFEAPVEAFKNVAGIKKKTVDLIVRFKEWNSVDRELERARNAGVRIVTAADPSYPGMLLHIYDYPPLLYVKGTLLSDEATIAVVGSRAATAYGKFVTERLGRELAVNGITVVSGMARGIDAAAHRGALSAKGRTIAVLGSGIDVAYPPENRSLYEEIVSSGAVLSEFPFQTPPNAPNFPMRNRIISGISLGVVIVEATDKSGSLITARMALEQGREVFAVPGTIDSPGSRGTHRLIKEGAKLVESIHDILEEIVPGKTAPLVQRHPSTDRDHPRRTDISAGEPERTVLGLLSKEAADVDTLIEKSGLSATDVLAILLSLELKGQVEQKPGKIFIRKEI